MGQSDSKVIDASPAVLTVPSNGKKAADEAWQVFNQICQLDFDFSLPTDQINNTLTETILQAQAIDLTALDAAVWPHSDAMFWDQPDNILRVFLIQGYWSGLARLNRLMLENVTKPAVAAFVLVGCDNGYEFKLQTKAYSELINRKHLAVDPQMAIWTSLQHTSLMRLYPSISPSVDYFLDWTLLPADQLHWSDQSLYCDLSNQIKLWLQRDGSHNFDYLALIKLILRYIQTYQDCAKILYHILADLNRIQGLDSKLMTALQGLWQQFILSHPEGVIGAGDTEQRDVINYHHSFKTPVDDNIVNYCTVLYRRGSSSSWLVSLIEHDHLTANQLEYLRQGDWDSTVWRALAIHSTTKMITKPKDLTEPARPS